MRTTQGIAFAKSFLRSDRGTTAIEYALIGSLIAVIIASNVSTLGKAIAQLYSKIELAFQ